MNSCPILDRLAELREKATPGEWRAVDGGSLPELPEPYPVTVRTVYRDSEMRRCTEFVATCESTSSRNLANAELMAAAVNALPLLIRAARALEKLTPLVTCHGPTCRAAPVGAVRKIRKMMGGDCTCDCGKADADAVLKMLEEL